MVVRQRIIKSGGEVAQVVQNHIYLIKLSWDGSNPSSIPYIHALSLSLSFIEFDGWQRQRERERELSLSFIESEREGQPNQPAAFAHFLGGVDTTCAQWIISI